MVIIAAGARHPPGPALGMFALLRIKILQRKVRNLHAFDENGLCISDGLVIGDRPSFRADVDFDFIGDLDDNVFSEILGLELPRGAIGETARDLR